ncbi:MAG: 6-bladed beta-propeller [Candidatus Micrarchaeota archaeon]
MEYKKTVAFAVLLLFASIFSAQNNTFTYVASYNASEGFGYVNVTLTNLEGLAIDYEGLIYVSDSSRQAVYVINSSDHVVKKIADSGIFSSLTSPTGIFLTEDTVYTEDRNYTEDIVYIADRGRQEVLFHTDREGIVGIKLQKALLPEPAAIWVEGNTLWVLDREESKLLEYDMETRNYGEDRFGKGMGSGRLNSPADMYFTEDRIYIADAGNNRVEVFDRNFEYIESMGTGKGGAVLSLPKGVVSDGSRIYVSDSENDRIVVFDNSGNMIESFGSSGKGEYEFESPGVLRLHGNMLYIIDKNNWRVVQYSINWSASKQNLEYEIKLANVTVQEYKRGVIDVLDSLGAAHEKFDGEEKIDEAYGYLMGEEHAMARNSMKEALDEIEERKAEEKESLNTELAKRIDDAKTALNYYGAKTLDLEGQKKIEQMSAYLSEGEAKLEEELFNECADIVISVEKSTKEMEEEYEEGKEKEAEKVDEERDVRETQKILIESRAAELTIKLDEMEGKANVVSEDVNLKPVETLISSANALVNAGVLDEANNSLNSAEAQLNEIEKKLDEKEEKIESVRKEIHDAWEIVNASQGLFVGKSRAAEELEMAEEIIYENPERASAHVEKALIYAGDVREGNYEFGGIVMVLAGMFFAIAIIAVVTIFFARKRIEKRKWELKGWDSRELIRKIKGGKKRGR